MNNQEMQKIFVCVSGPSCVGKTSLISESLKILKKEGVSVAATLSSTNRPMRKNETEGVEYRFLGKDGFERRYKNGEFFITSSVHGNRYGTLNEDILSRNEDLLVMNIDCPGAMEMKRRYPENTVLVFIGADPSVLLSRLEARNDSAEETEKRKKDIYRQLSEAVHYEYIIFNNDELQRAVNEFAAIVRAQCNRSVLADNRQAIRDMLAKTYEKTNVR